MYAIGEDQYSPDLACVGVVAFSNHIIHELNLSNMLPVTDEIEPIVPNPSELKEYICNTRTRKLDHDKAIGAIKHYKRIHTDEQSYARLINSNDAPIQQFKRFGHLFGLRMSPGSLFIGTEDDDFYDDDLPKRYQLYTIFKQLDKAEEGTRFIQFLLFYITFTYWNHVNRRFLVPTPGSTNAEFQRPTELIANYNFEWSVQEGQKAKTKKISDQLKAYHGFFKDKDRVDEWVALRPFNQGPVYEAARNLNAISFFFFILILVDGEQCFQKSARKKLGISAGSTWAPFRLLACPYPREKEILTYLAKNYFAPAYISGSSSLPAQKARAARLEQVAETASANDEKFEIQERPICAIDASYFIQRIKFAQSKRKYGVSLPTYFASPFSYLSEPIVAFHHKSFVTNFFGLINLFLPVMPAHGIGDKIQPVLNFTEETDYRNDKKRTAFQYILAQDKDTYAAELSIQAIVADLQSRFVEDAKKVGFEFAGNHMQRQAFQTHPFWKKHQRNCYVLVKSQLATVATLSQKVADDCKPIAARHDKSAASNQVIGFFPPMGVNGPANDHEWRYDPHSLDCCVHYYHWTAFVTGVPEGHSLSSVETFGLTGPAKEAYEYAIETLEEGPVVSYAHTSIGWFDGLQDIFDRTPWRCTTEFGMENHNVTWLAYAFYRLLYSRRFTESTIWLALYCLVQDTEFSTVKGNHLSVFRVLEAQRPYRRDNEFHTAFCAPLAHGFARLQNVYRIHLEAVMNALYTGPDQDKELEQDPPTRGRKRKAPVQEVEHKLIDYLFWRNRPLKKEFYPDDTSLSESGADWEHNLDQLAERLICDLSERPRALVERFFPIDVRGFLLYQGYSAAPDLCRSRALAGVVKTVHLTMHQKKGNNFLANLEPDFLKFFNYNGLLQNGALELCVPEDRAHNLSIVEPCGRRIWTIGDGANNYTPHTATDGKPVPVKEEEKKTKKSRKPDYSAPRAKNEPKQQSSWPTQGTVYRTYTGANCYQFIHASLFNALLAPAAFYLQQCVYRPVFSSIQNHNPEEPPVQWEPVIAFKHAPKTHGRKSKKKRAAEEEEQEKELMAVPIISQPTTFMNAYTQGLKNAVAPFEHKQPIDSLFLEMAERLNQDMHSLPCADFYLQASATFALAYLCHKRASQGVSEEEAAKLAAPRGANDFINRCDWAIAKTLKAVKKVAPSDSHNFVWNRLKIVAHEEQAPLRIELEQRISMEMARLQTRRRNPFEIEIYQACADFRKELRENFDRRSAEFRNARELPGLHLRLGQIYQRIYEQLIKFYSPAGAHWFATTTQHTDDKYDLEHFRLLSIPFSLEERSAMALVYTLFDCDEYRRNGYYIQGSDDHEWTAFARYALNHDDYKLVNFGGIHGRDLVYRERESNLVDIDTVRPHARWLVYVVCSWASVCVSPDPDKAPCFRFSVCNDHTARVISIGAPPAPTPASLPPPQPLQIEQGAAVAQHEVFDKNPLHDIWQSNPRDTSGIDHAIQVLREINDDDFD